VTTETPQAVVMAVARPTRPWDHAAKLLLVLDGVKGEKSTTLVSTRFKRFVCVIRASFAHVLLSYALLGRVFFPSDPGNLGTLVRTGVACGVGGVLLVGPCADPWAPKALRYI